MSTDHTIRPATMADHAAVAGVLRSMYEDHAIAEPRRFRADDQTLTPAYLAAILDDPDAAVLVSEHDNFLSGAIVVRMIESPAEDIVVARRFGYVDSIAVDAAAQGNGIGRLLMDAAETWVRSRGAMDLELNVATSNPDAIRFYERLGFRPVWFRLTKDLAG